jgi:Leucine-rich repeat (LRR) protein
LAGEAPPAEWVRFIDELDLSGTPLNDLSPLKTLTALQNLGLSGTRVSDLSALQGFDQPDEPKSLGHQSC